MRPGFVRQPARGSRPGVPAPHARLAAFRADLRGSIGIVFALALPVAALAIGGAIDAARVYQYRDKLQAAADQSLAESLSGPSDRSDDDRAVAARRAFAAAALAHGVVASEPIQIAFSDVAGVRRASVAATSSVELLFGKLLKLPRMKVAVTATMGANYAAAEDRRRKCHIGKPDDVKRLRCGGYS